MRVLVALCVSGGDGMAEIEKVSDGHHAEADQLRVIINKSSC